MFKTLALLSRTSYRGAAGSGPGRRPISAAKSSPDSTTKRIEHHASNIFKRAQRGLYDGVRIQFGNNVPESRQKTRRTFKPNVQMTRVHSDVLDRELKLNMTMRAKRSIIKHGGVDHYLAMTPDWKLGALGVRLRKELAAKVANAGKDADTIPSSAKRVRLGYLRKEL